MKCPQLAPKHSIVPLVFGPVKSSGGTIENEILKGKGSLQNARDLLAKDQLQDVYFIS